MTIIYEILKESWHIYLDVSIYMLFGFLLQASSMSFSKLIKLNNTLEPVKSNRSSYLHSLEYPSLYAPVALFLLQQALKSREPTVGLPYPL